MTLQLERELSKERERKRQRTRERKRRAGFQVLCKQTQTSKMALQLALCLQPATKPGTYIGS